MIYQSSALQELSTWDLSTLRVVRTSSWYWKWRIAAYQTSGFLHWAFKYLIFHTRHYMSRGQVYLRHLISEPQKVSNGCKWANISFSCFPRNEYILFVRFAVYAETVKLLRYVEQSPQACFFTTEITSWRVLSPCTCRCPLWICSPARTAVCNLLRNMSSLRAAETEKKNPNNLDLGSESWRSAVNVTAPQQQMVRQP